MPPKKINTSSKSPAVRKKRTVKKKEEMPIKIEPELMLEKSQALVFNPLRGQTNPKVNLYKKIAFSFVLLTFVLLGVIFYFSFVKLSITLIPVREKITDNLVIDVYNKKDGGAPEGRNLVGAVESVNLEDEINYPASGAEIVGEEVIGRALLINKSNKNQPLVATTRLLSPDNKLFRTKETVNVPAGGSVQVEIYADQASPDMAIAPTRFTLPGLWPGMQDKIFAETDTALSYEKKVKKTIEQSDIDQAVKDIKNNLISKAEKEIGSGYKGLDKVIFSVDDNSVVLDIDSKVGEEKDSFKVKIKAAIYVIAFSNDDVAKLAEKKLSGIIPSGKKLSGFEANKIKYTVNDININQGLASVNAEFEGAMAVKENSDIIDPNKIIGLTKNQLEDYLSSFREIKDYEVNFTPSFVNKVPSLIDRIEIRIEE